MGGERGIGSMGRNKKGEFIYLSAIKKFFHEIAPEQIRLESDFDFYEKRKKIGTIIELGGGKEELKGDVVFFLRGIYLSIARVRLRVIMLWARMHRTCENCFEIAKELIFSP